MSTNNQALRERYSAEPTPKCHVCGTEMTVQRMSASRITYGCTGATYDDTGCHYTAGRSIADDHYEQSRVTVVDVSDPDVLALLDELEAAEKRTITVKLPAEYLLDDGSLNADMMNTCAVVGAFREALAAAGITVKGDSE